MKLISWEHIWITIRELDRTGNSGAQEVFLKAILDIGAFDDRGVWIHDASREERS